MKLEIEEDPESARLRHGDDGRAFAGEELHADLAPERGAREVVEDGFRLGAVGNIKGDDDFFFSRSVHWQRMRAR